MPKLKYPLILISWFSEYSFKKYCLNLAKKIDTDLTSGFLLSDRTMIPFENLPSSILIRINCVFFLLINFEKSNESYSIVYLLELLF
ncbi:hypothetical protein BpHYR1_051888 [Brachionus plicatilis]|uniref:Uncharacterized protein n=1 Tax=Brachionus plicatilis TaxID=10195 RepID=A0A3M7RLK8_BRAPC|nr:hypothetical protein BpHYR1_051888 [Brachionus plicatilis]